MASLRHRVLASVRDRLLPIPINRTTLNGLYGLNLRDEAATEAFLKTRAEPVDPVVSSRDVVINQIGSELYRPSSRAIRASSGASTRAISTSRSPPASRRAAMPTIAISWTGSRRCRSTATRRCSRTCSTMTGSTWHSGPISATCAASRSRHASSIRADRRVFRPPFRAIAVPQPAVPARNARPAPLPVRRRRQLPDPAVPYTRITEYKHLTGQVHGKTSISYEFPQAMAIPTIHTAARERGPLQALRRAGRAARRGHFVGASEHTATTTWTGGRPGAGDLPPHDACSRPDKERGGGLRPLIVLATDSREPSGMANTC